MVSENFSENLLLSLECGSFNLQVTFLILCGEHINIINMHIGIFHILKYLIIKETNINASEIYDFEKDCMIESVKKEWIKRTNLYQDVKDSGAFR